MTLTAPSRSPHFCFPFFFSRRIQVGQISKTVYLTVFVAYNVTSSFFFDHKCRCLFRSSEGIRPIMSLHHNKGYGILCGQRVILTNTNEWVTSNTWVVVNTSHIYWKSVVKEHIPNQGKANVWISCCVLWQVGPNVSGLEYRIWMYSCGVGVVGKFPERHFESEKQLRQLFSYISWWCHTQRYGDRKTIWSMLRIFWLMVQVDILLIDFLIAFNL